MNIIRPKKSSLGHVDRRPYSNSNFKRNYFQFRFFAIINFKTFSFVHILIAAIICGHFLCGHFGLFEICPWVRYNRQLWKFEARYGQRDQRWVHQDLVGRTSKNWFLNSKHLCNLNHYDINEQEKTTNLKWSNFMSQLISMSDNHCTWVTVIQ